MKKTISLIILLCSYYSYAQVGIGTTTPDPSSILHVDSSNKGFLPPLVNLTSINDVSTIASPAEGLMVYSPTSNDCNLPSGLYVFNNSEWQRVSFSSGSNTYTRLIRDEIGIDNVTFTAHNSYNSYGNYASLFNNTDDTGASSFHSLRSGTPTDDWGFGITLPNKYFITQLILNGRNDCCTNRIVNVVAKLYSCGRTQFCYSTYTKYANSKTRG